MSATAQRYTAVAIVLHWAIAFAIALMIPLGFWMHEQSEHGGAAAGLFSIYQLHKSIGLTVLGLSLVRLAWRLMNPPPPMPEHMPAWERFIALATHWAFYGLMIGLPLTGWLYVSAGWSIHDEQPLLITTHWFGLFVVPHLFGLPQASADVREAVAGASMAAHFYLAWATVGLAALHVAAALKHHFFDRDEVLAHMVPGVRAPFEEGARPKNPARLAVLGGGLSIVAVALVAALFAIFTWAAAPVGAPPTTTTEVATTEVPPATTLAPTTETTVAGPAAWQVDSRASSVRFAFSFADAESGDNTRFEGRFNRWRADIRFDPENLEASSARVTIELASAVDGVALHERNLPTAPWFNVTATPNATFHATSFRHRSGANYEARGELTIRGRARNITLPFTLNIEGNRAIMDGRTTIDRNDFDIGKDTEADDMISREVEVILHVEAVRAP